MYHNYQNIEPGEYEAPDGDEVELLDIGADAVNASTGTGENLGWFGEIDRGLDPRNPDEWADPTEETTGLSGFARATGGVAGYSAEQVGGGFLAGVAGSKEKGLLALGAAALVILVVFAGV